MEINCGFYFQIILMIISIHSRSYICTYTDCKGPCGYSMWTVLMIKVMYIN